MGAFVYPKNNQGTEQQKKDQMNCFNWAKQQTGIDPMAPALPPQQQAQAQDKERKDALNRAFSACLESKGYTVKQAAGGVLNPGSEPFPS